MKGRRLWLRLSAHGSTIPVYVTRRPLAVDGHEVKAYFDGETPCIVLAWSDNVAAMKQTLHHEILHVCFAGHSGDARQAVLGGRTPAARAKREEQIVSFLEPVQYDLLVRNGFLRYPKPPRV